MKEKIFLRTQNIVELIINKLYRYPLTTTTCSALLLMFICAEIISNRNAIGFWDAFSSVLVLFLGELGEVNGDPITKIANLVGLLSGVIFVSIIGAKIVTCFVEQAMRGGKIMKKTHFKNLS